MTKENGQSIIVSKFIFEECSWLKLSSEEIRIYPNIPKETHCYIMPSKNQENYWTIDSLLNQIQNKAIPIFEAKFPNAITVFAFDNSTNHAAYAKDILVASRMNLGPGRNQPVMWSMTYNDANRDQQFQSMVFDEDFEDPAMRGKSKEIKWILQERGLWREELHLDCKLYKNKGSQNDPLWINCYAKKIMASQPDFITQRSTIVELIENAGHLCILYLNFYCELNFIEMYWVQPSVMQETIAIILGLVYKKLYCRHLTPLILFQSGGLLKNPGDTWNCIMKD